MQTNVKRDDLKVIVKEIVCGVMGEMKTEIDKKFTDMNQKLREKIQDGKNERTKYDKVEAKIRKTVKKSR